MTDDVVRRGTCPHCRRDANLDHRGRIGFHHKPEMRMSRGRWFRDRCPGSGRAPLDGMTS